jgi:hypothetical protein
LSQPLPNAFGRCKAAELDAVVDTVRVAVAAEAPVIETGEVEPKLKVGNSEAPAGELVSAAVRVTLPVNPPAGVTVIVEVFAVAAPGATVTEVPAKDKLGFAAAVTVMASFPVSGR